MIRKWKVTGTVEVKRSGRPMRPGEKTSEESTHQSKREADTVLVVPVVQYKVWWR